MVDPHERPRPVRATYEDLLAVPDPLVGEILDGERVTSPRPAARHAACTSAMGITIGGAFHGPSGAGPGPGGWWILDEPELHLGADVLVPDLAGWRRERLPEVPDVPYLTLAPDWIGEVLSPGTARIDRVVKLRLYARARIPHLWLVDPRERTLETLVLDGEAWRLAGTWAGGDVVRAAPFDAVPLSLAGGKGTTRAWPEPRRPRAPGAVCPPSA